MSAKPPRTRFKRVELKSIIDPSTRASLAADLERRLVPDEHGDGTGHYPVVSLHADTADFDVYSQRARGLRYRSKLRVRLYGEAGAHSCFLEIKQRWKKRVAKRRVALPLEDALRVLRDEAPERWPSGEGLSVVEEARALVRHCGLAPSCVMRYERRAFSGTGDEAHVRVTLDSLLRYRFRDLVPAPADDDFDGFALPEDRTVLEVKVDGAVPYWLSVLVSRHGCVLQSVSKYCFALERSGLLERPNDIPGALPGSLEETSGRAAPVRARWRIA